MKKNSLRFLTLTLIGLLIYSCQNEDDFLEPNSSIENFEIENNESDYSFGEKIILGKKLKNPYSIENMKIAYNSLKSKKENNKSNRKTLSKEIDISATHRYIKFIPKDSLELKMIEADTTLILYDYPLDYEILQMGDYYHDPNVPVTQPTYHYASVEEGKTLPISVEYEVLSDLFIPDEEDIPDDFKELLTDEALKLTDNLKSESKDKNIQARASKWRPAGRIRVWDDKIGSTSTTTRVFSHWEYYDCDGNDEIQPINQQRLIPIDDGQCKRAVYRYITTTTDGSYIPVHGVKVRARRWFTTHTGITNEQGYYSCNGRFRRPANYKIKWKRHDFSIWWSWLSSAKYNGPKKKGDWNLNIKGGTQEYYATIFRGAHLYYYGNMFGLTRPPSKKWGLRRLVINARKKSGRSNYVKARRLVLAADITLKAWGSPTDRIFGTTIHELAHAAHREVDKSAYNSLVWKGYTSPCLPSAESCDNPGPTGANARRLMETWASTVEHFIVKERYENYYNVQDFNYSFGRNYLQLKTINEDNFYTSCGIDLMDDFNQRDEYGNLRPIDRVDSYTINQLENSLKNATTWFQWKNNLKTSYNNSTQEFLDELFTNWANEH
jgi:hypothetical protein